MNRFPKMLQNLPCVWRTRAVLPAVAAAAFSIHPASAVATTLYWDGGNANIAGNGDGLSAGGSGTWSTGIANWDAGSGVAHVHWPLTTDSPAPSTYTADFGGTAGTVTLGSAITVGGLTFEVGGYTIAGGGYSLTLATGSVITTNGGTTTFSSLSLAGAGGVALTKTGSGTLALSNSNGSLGTSSSPDQWTVTGGSYSSGTGIFDSVLSVAAGNNLGAAAATGNSATQLVLDAGALQITGTSLSPAIGDGRTIQVNTAGGAIVDSNGNPFYGSVADGAGSGSSLYLSNASGTTTFTSDGTGVGGVISGAGSLTWNGAGKLVLGGTNTFSGGTVIEAGTVSVSSNANLGNTSGAVTLNGGTLTTTANLNGSAAAVFAHNIATGTVGGTIDVPANIALALNYFNNNTTGDVSGSGTITKADSGQLVLSGNNSGYSGNWNVTGGILEVQYNGSTSLGSGSVTLASGTEISLNYANTISNAISSSGGTLSFASGNGGIYSGGITLASGTMTTIGLRDFYGTTTARSGSITGIISGSGALATSGGGVLTLRGANTYGGGTTINNGTISFSSNGNLGANSGAVNLGGGILSDTGNVAGSASAVFAHNIATGTVGGTIDVASGATLGLNYYNNNTTGNISGSGPLTKTGAGQLVLSGSNGGYSGNWTFSAGIVEVQYNGSTSLGSGSVSLASGTEMALDYANTISNAISSSGGALSFANSSGGIYSGGITLASGTTTIGLRDFYNASNARSGSISGVVSGSGSLATSGGGVLTLTNNDTYTGTTAVAAGTLLVNGDNTSATGAVTVSTSGSVLGGTGKVGGATEIASGATITGAALGAGAVGTLTLKSTLTLDSGSTYAVDVSSASSYDKLVISGALSSNGATISLNSGALDGTSTYTIATYASDTGSTFTLSGVTGYSLFDTGTALELVPVPEPGTWIGGGVMVLVAGWGMRRHIKFRHVL